MEVEKSWAIVEVMGHRRYAGQISEATVAGVPMLRVSVPQVEVRRVERDWREFGGSGRSVRCEREVVEQHAAFEVDLGGSSLFAVTRCTEDAARAALRHTHRGSEVHVVEGEWRDLDAPPQLVDAEVVDLPGRPTSEEE